jgi:hypothetical protein
MREPRTGSEPNLRREPEGTSEPTALSEPQQMSEPQILREPNRSSDYGGAWFVIAGFLLGNALVVAILVWQRI